MGPVAGRRVRVTGVLTSPALGLVTLFLNIPAVVLGPHIAVVPSPVGVTRVLRVLLPVHAFSASLSGPAGGALLLVSPVRHGDCDL